MARFGAKIQIGAIPTRVYALWKIVFSLLLFEMLKSERISGAILDVFDPEPIPKNSKQWDVPNLIISPHISADDGASYVDNTLSLFFDNLDRFISNRSLLNTVDKNLGY